MNLEHLGIAVAIIAQFIGLIYVMRKFPSEQKSMEAEIRHNKVTANKELAEAGGEWLANYNTMFTMLHERDEKLISLSARMLVLEERDKTREEELRIERERRMAAERRADAADAKIAELNNTVTELRSEIAQLKRTPTPVNPDPVSIP